MNLVLFDLEPDSGSVSKVVDPCRQFIARLRDLDFDSRVEAINKLRELIHAESPFRSEPVDYVRWVRNTSVRANDYNPNSVAPPEMELLRTSITQDGYTQPIVSMPDGSEYEVVDGFHRHRVGKECAEVQSRVHGFLPVVCIRHEQFDRSHRIASTIRHNRARGKHQVDAMSDIVVELKRRNWSESRICKELGMDKDEVLRLCQITGLSELFSDQEFSSSWDVEGAVTEEDIETLTDDVLAYGEITEEFRASNTNDESRIFHTYEKWECYAAGFYATTMEGMSRDQCEEAYRDFLRDDDRFARALAGVIEDWKHSCEHYLTNKAMNRIAWLGQAAACYEMGIPAQYRTGFYLLTEDEQSAANELALEYLNRWMVANDRPVLTMEEAYSGERQVDIY